MRDKSTLDTDAKALFSRNVALEQEVQRLKKEIEEKFANSYEKSFNQNDLQIQNKTLAEQVKTLLQ